MNRFFKFFEDSPFAGIAPLLVIPVMIWTFMLFQGLGASQPVSVVQPVPVVQPVKATEMFQIAKVLAKANWNDEFNKPAWHVVTTTDGETVLRIHGSPDGLVWGGPEEFIQLDEFLKRLPMPVTKIMTCHPMQVQKRSGVSQKFFHPNHMAPIYGTSNMLPGSLIRVQTFCDFPSR